MAPWASVARVQIPGVSRCTGVLVAARWVVTAAHCMGARRLGHVAPASSVHVLFGYHDGSLTRHVQPDRVVVPAPDRVDLALLHLAEPLPGGLRPVAEPVEPGTVLALAGYGQDRAERMMADEGCRARGYARNAAGAAVLLHDCTATRGDSGGPVLMRGPGGEWRVAGMAVGANAASAGGTAVPGFILAQLLAEAGD